MNDTLPTVLMHSEVDLLMDSLLSPTDGCFACGAVLKYLAKAHKPRRKVWRRARPGRPRSLPVYVGTFDVLPVEFAYVQPGNTLHVLDAWDTGLEGTTKHPDCVLSTDGIDLIDSNGNVF